MIGLRRYFNQIASVRPDWLQSMVTRRSVRGLLALCAVVVLAQGIELTHSHDDLQSQLDCHICLKLGTKGKAVTAAGLEFNAESSSAVIDTVERHLPFLAVPPANSRAPPRYS